jgi:hypothetical protein
MNGSLIDTCALSGVCAALLVCLRMCFVRAPCAGRLQAAEQYEAVQSRVNHEAEQMIVWVWLVKPAEQYEALFGCCCLLLQVPSWTCGCVGAMVAV